MIAIAFRRMLSKFVARWRVLGREQGLVDRGWQDKSRKVRPVGRVRIASKFRYAPNIANICHNLSFSPRHCFGSTFCTLRGPR